MNSIAQIGLELLSDCLLVDVLDVKINLHKKIFKRQIVNDIQRPLWRIKIDAGPVCTVGCFHNRIEYRVKDWTGQDK